MSNPLLIRSGQGLLAKYLERQRANGNVASNEIARCPADAVVQASEAQQQFWLHSQIAANVPLYNEPTTLHIEAELNVPAFERAFNYVVNRHEAWRTVLEWRDNKLIQVVKPEIHTALPVLDLRKRRQSERERLALELAQEDAIAPFDPSKLPLFRARLVQFGDSQYRLYLTLLHVIFDGVALYQIFLPELQACYTAFDKNAEPDLLPLHVQYRDYCVWQQSRAALQLNSHLSYWERQLSGKLPELQLPLDRPRPPAREFRGGMETFAIPGEVSNQLRRIGQLREATFYMTILAGFHVLLFHLTGQHELMIGSENSQRKQQSTERMLGLFLNVVLLRTAFAPQDTFLDLVSRMRETVLDALTHEVPFSALVSRFGKDRKPGMNPLFQVLFSLEPPLQKLAPGWNITQMDIETSTSKFDLSLEMDERAEGLIGRFIFASDIFDRLTIQRITGKWGNLLSLIAADPNRKVASLSEELSRTNPVPISSRTKSIDRGILSGWLQRLQFWRER